MRHLNQREPILHAYQLMSYPVATVQMTLDIVSAWQRFSGQHYQQLPILDKQQRIVGMLSEHDLLRFLILDDRQLSYVRGKTVGNAMSGEVITADPVSDVRRIAQVMLTHHLGAMPMLKRAGHTGRIDIAQ